MIFLGKVRGSISYPDREYGFSPSKYYPEYFFDDKSISPVPNEIYDLVRNGFFQLGLDKNHYGTKDWNPLGEMIKENDKVLLKPNMVLHDNIIQANGWECLITHPSIVRVIIDYVIIALKGTGEVKVADAPVQSCDFEKLLVTSGYVNLIEFYSKYNIAIEFLDLRNCKVLKKGIVHQIDKNQKSNESIIVNLKDKSKFSDFDSEDNSKLRITSYDPSLLRQYHNQNGHKYCISEEVLNADVIFNLPKVKTHKKAGVTISLKNMVGIVTDKTCLPHHRIGAPEDSGDEYRKKSVLKKISSKSLDIANELQHNEKYYRASFFNTIGFLTGKLGAILGKDYTSEGSWNGNDTIWRMVYDLNYIVRYADKLGAIQQDKQRKIFNIADMVIAGEGNGPLAPSPRGVGIIAMGEDSACLDSVLCAIMGIDIKKIPTIYNCTDNMNMEEVIVAFFPEQYKNSLFDLENYCCNFVYNFKLADGWKSEL